MADQADFADIKSQAADLKSSLSGQDTVFQEMENIFFMDDPDLRRPQDQPFTKYTYSPDGHNRLLGAVRLMVATDPVFKADREKHGAQISNQIERAAAGMWAASGEVVGQPAQWDLCMSGLLYGRAHLGIVSTKALLDAAKGAQADRVKRTHKRTPYLFEVYNPRTCFPYWDRHGLAAHYREVKTTARQVLGDWGEPAQAALAGKKGSDAVTLCEWWDSQYQVVWVDSGKTPVVNQAHGLPFLPIVATHTEGNPRLFSDIKQQLMPMLYALNKSGLHKRQSLALTVLYTMIFGIGANPMFKHIRSTDGQPMDLDFSTPGGVIHLNPGEDVQSMLKQVIDPSLLQGLEIANQLAEQSTIYSQALGQPLGGGTTYSTVALLTQAGRLPLAGPQRTLSWLIAEAVRIAFEWLKVEGGARRASYGSKNVEIKAADIPDDLDLEAHLDITLPQEYLQMVNQANLVTASGLTSKAWARSEILNIGQSEDMDREIYQEKMVENLVQLYLQQQIQQMQAQQQPPAAPQLPPQGPPPMEQMPAEMPPMSAGGLPPEMMMQGGQGPYPPEGMG